MFKILYCLSALTFGVFCVNGAVCAYYLTKACKAYLEQHAIFSKPTYTSEKTQ